MQSVELLRDEQQRSLTRQEFCLLEHMSPSTYHKLQRAGLGPDEIKFPGMAFVRITAEARREWHARIEEERKTQAAKLEDQRRRERARKAGQKAAQSPRHVSKRGKVKRRVNVTAARDEKRGVS
jgi:hypothetical protein